MRKMRYLLQFLKGRKIKVEIIVGGIIEKNNKILMVKEAKKKL